MQVASSARPRAVDASAFAISIEGGEIVFVCLHDRKAVASCVHSNHPMGHHHALRTRYDSCTNPRGYRDRRRRRGRGTRYHTNGHVYPDRMTDLKTLGYTIVL
jgi:hypothetical protein